MNHYDFDDERILDMVDDLRHRAKLEREIHNDNVSAKYLESIAGVVNSVLELREENEDLRRENRKLKERVADLRDLLKG